MPLIKTVLACVSDGYSVIDTANKEKGNYLFQNCWVAKHSPTSQDHRTAFTLLLFYAQTFFLLLWRKSKD